MAIRYLPMDSTDGDRVITSADMAELFETMADDGYVMNEGAALNVIESVPPAMTVQVGTGAAWVQGRFFQIYNAAENLVIPTADPINPRIDRIVIRRNLADRRMELAVLSGVASPDTNLAPPVLTRDATIWEISLAQVRVAAGAVAIYNANITDERDNPDVCGASYHPSIGGANFIEDVDDSIKENHIDWGTGANQISAVDVPIADTGLNYAATNVEAALAEEADARQAHESRRDNPHGVTAAQVGAIPTGGGDATGNVSFNNNVGVKGRNTVGTLHDLIKINNYNNLQVGDAGRNTVLLGSQTPQYYDGAAFHDLWHKGNFDPNAVGTVAARLTRNLPVSVGAGAKTNQIWNDVIFQTGGGFWVNTTPDRILIPVDGFYVITACFRLADCDNGEIGIYRNGSMKIAKHQVDSSTPTYLTVTTIYKFTAGDYITFEIVNNGDNTCTSEVNSYYSPIVGLAKV